MNGLLQSPIKHRTIPIALGTLIALASAVTAAAQVQQGWVARYNGPQNSDDVVMSLAVDNAGNVYVTGRSHTNSQSAYTTIRYGPNGHQLWIARYTGHANGDNLVTDVIADDAGNVYVTGASPGTNAVYELATVKYDANGNQLWVARSQAAGSNATFLGGDFSTTFLRGFSLAFDGEGNLLVFGLSPGESNTIDHVVIKYDGDGRPLSERRYHIPGVAQLAGKLDSTGQLYVTGWATAKFDTNGTAVWINDDVGGAAIDFDASGNVYVADLGFGTKKLDPAGNLLWSAYYDGADHSLDEARAIAVDKQGNVFVTGLSTYWQHQNHGGTGPDELMGVVTVKYGPNGQQLWMAFYNLASSGYVDAHILLDSDGHAYVSGQGVAADYPFQNKYSNVTVKYATNGSQLWAVPYNGPGQFFGDRPFPTALDSLGNVYVALTTFSNSTRADFVTLKYTQANVAGFPSITVSPQSHEAVEGSNVAFTVSATGEEPLSYQWRWSGFDFEDWITNAFNIPDATNRSLVLTNVTQENAGDFAVLVKNAAGVTISAEARLVVQRPFLGLRLLQPRMSDGVLGFILNVHEPGHYYSIQASTNLTDWRVVHTVFMESEQFPIILDDVASGPGYQFYRAKLEPDE